MTEQHRTLVAHALVRYGFRVPNKADTEAGYLAALIAHVEVRDFAAAHELRLGVPQADWTPDQVKSFETAIMANRGPRTAFAPGDAPPVVGGVCVAGFEATDECLIELAHRGLETVMLRRHEDATAELPIFLSVLLMTGDLLTTHVGRANRIALIKHLAQSLPVFGFFLIFDAFMHQIQETKATKVDTILCQLGTRDPPPDAAPPVSFRRRAGDLRRAPRGCRSANNPRGRSLRGDFRHRAHVGAPPMSQKPPTQRDLLLGWIRNWVEDRRPEERAMPDEHSAHDVRIRITFTESEIMALIDIIAEHVRRPDHTEVYVDAARQTETTPEALLSKLLNRTWN